ncbi:IS66 family insertion sequence element accessory protein TnpB [Paraburkholderia sp. IMGN_8]|uniref:IS66 family insertion sequence element accessory protein TnpB n=1 Tax=Paraburkholderia sp. IMGN_8 TaxID=3136564 RepID=UPI0031011388
MLIAADVRAHICRDTVDLRKAIDGLSYLVEPLLAQNPASDNLFVFVGRDRSKVKVLYWDRTGFALWYNRLERGRFVWPHAQTYNRANCESARCCALIAMLQ